MDKEQLKIIVRKILNDRGVSSQTNKGCRSHHRTSYKHGDFYMYRVLGYEDGNLCAYGTSVKYRGQCVFHFDCPNPDDFEPEDWIEILSQLVRDGVPEMDAATRVELENPDHGRIGSPPMLAPPDEDYQIGDLERQWVAAWRADLDAAGNGDARAQCDLGAHYATGEFVGGYMVTQNYEEAVKWFRLAAEQGLAAAQHNLGVCYEHGHGVTQDHAEAATWFDKAAAQDFAPAQQALNETGQRSQ